MVARVPRPVGAWSRAFATPARHSRSFAAQIVHDVATLHTKDGERTVLTDAPEEGAEARRRLDATAGARAYTKTELKAFAASLAPLSEGRRLEASEQPMYTL